jgi:hypothetical protein
MRDFILMAEMNSGYSVKCCRKAPAPGMAKTSFKTASGWFLIVFMLAIPLIAVSCGDSSRIRVKGKIENSEGRVLYFDKVQVDRISLLDSTVLKSNGNFSFRAPAIEDPSFYRLRLSENNFITLLAEPGEVIAVTADASNLPGTYSVEGSDGSELLKKLNDRLLATKRQIDPLIREILALEEETAYHQEEARINEELEAIIKAQRDFSIAFIIENMESMAAITALYQMLDDNEYVLNQTRDIQFLKIVAEALMKKYPRSPHVKALAADAENQERQYEIYRLTAMAEQSGQVITTYPDIAMPGRDGDTISLHAVPQKYKLVLFGSSLNPASVQLSHELIPVYNAYRNKGFQIYQISVERSREEWLRSIEFSELPWIHVAELGEGNFMAAQAYNVQQIPSNYLINTDVGVIARNLTAPELRRRLARALD